MAIALFAVASVVSVAALLEAGSRPGAAIKNFGVVEDASLYRSGRLTPATMRHAAQHLGVRSFIDFGANPPGSDAEHAIDAEARRLGVTIHRLRMKGDGRGDPENYVEALRLMADPARMEPMLVHCAAGSERTGVCVLLYRTVVQGWDTERAYREAFGYGHSPGDNWRFMAYVAEWRDEIEHAFKHGGPIPEPRYTRADAGTPSAP